MCVLSQCFITFVFSYLHHNWTAEFMFINVAFYIVRLKIVFSNLSTSKSSQIREKNSFSSDSICSTESVVFFKCSHCFFFYFISKCCFLKLANACLCTRKLKEVIQSISDIYLCKYSSSICHVAYRIWWSWLFTRTSWLCNS